MKEKHKVLIITQHLDSGGIESFLFNIYNNVNKENLQIDFFICESKYIFYEEKLKKLGANIYYTLY